MMDKRLTVIYADAAEKFVKNVVLYLEELDGALYYDEDYVEEVNGAELENLFLKGLVIKSPSGEYCVAETFWINEAGAHITYAIGDEHYTTNNSIVNEEEAE